MDAVNLDFVDNPWAAFVAIVMVLALVVWPGLLAWLNSRATKHATREIRGQLDHEMKPNSGSSLKDALNRIEGRQQDQGQLLSDHTVLLNALADRTSILERDSMRRHRGRITWRRD